MAGAFCWGISYSSLASSHLGPLSPLGFGSKSVYDAPPLTAKCVPQPAARTAIEDVGPPQNPARRLSQA
jgi:hypothetical protein